MKLHSDLTWLGIRSVLSLSLAAVVGSAAADAGKANEWNIEQSRAPEQVELDREFSEGTWMSLDVSPDGRYIVFDLLGHIYEMPIEGGNARALTSGRSLNLLPRYSPDGSRIAFSSDRDGSEDLWVIERTSGKLRNVTNAAPLDRIIGATWSADGSFLYGTVFKEMFLTPYQFDQYGGRQKLMEGQPFSPIGNFQDDSVRQRLLFEQRDQSLPTSGSRIKIYDKRTGEISVYIERPGGAVSPALSRDGRYLVYVHREGLDTQLILHDLGSREERVLLQHMDHDRQDSMTMDMHGGYPTMGWLPDSKTVVLWHRGGIWSVDVLTGKAQKIPFLARVQRSMDKTIRFRLPAPDTQVHTRIHRWAQRTSQGVVFETLGDIYLRTDRETKNLTQSAAHETSPLYDEVSRTLFYVSWSDDEFGAIYARKLAGGKPRKLTSKPAQYGALELSPDGTKLVFLRGDDRILNGEQLHRQTHFNVVTLDLKENREQTVAQMLWDGAEARHMEMPSVRFSSDGGQLYFSELSASTIRVVRVDLDGGNKTELYHLPKASSANISPDGRWIAYQQHHRTYLTPVNYLGKPVTVSAVDRAGTSLRIDAEHDGIYQRWSTDSRSLMWVRGAQLIEKTVDDVIAGSSKITSSSLDIVFPVDTPKAVIALKGARVISIDSDRRVLENATVLIRGSRIDSVGAGIDIPADAKVFDLQGRTIVPGLIDAHAHMKARMSPLGVIEQRVPVLHSNLAFGVTTLYEVWGSIPRDFWLADMVLEGAAVGPRIYSVGTALSGPHRFLESSYREMNSYEDVLEHVRFNKAFGATALKDYNPPSRQARQCIAMAARAGGLNVVVEPSFEAHSNLSRVIDGATELAHDIGFSIVYDDYVQMFATNRLGITTTFSVEEGNFHQRRDRLWEDPKLNRFARRDTLIADMRQVQRVPNLIEDEYLHPIVGANLKRLHDAGVPIQAGGHGETLGMDMHFEMEAHVQGGFTNMEALSTATIGNAWNSGLDRDLGSVEPGKLADLIILRANPLDDIRNTLKIELVMKNGVLYSGEDAARVFPNPKPAGEFYFKRGESNAR